MPEKLHIPEPCPAEWDKMSACDNGRFCGFCSKVVVDFSNKTLTEIQDYLTANDDKQVCGRYQERHTTVTNRWYDVLNFIEDSLAKVKLHRLAILIVGILLFISGCRSSRRTQGYRVTAQGKFLTQDILIQTHHSQQRM